MKCADTTGDRKADAIIRAGGVQCEEYGTHLADDGAICTWVAVSDDQKLSVDTGFTGLTQELQFDLVIDGVLRNSEKTNRKAEKKDRKLERFEHGFYAQNKMSIIEADLKIKPLDTSAYPSVQIEGKHSVGAIEVRISVLRNPNEERHKLNDVKTFETIMDWKEAHRSPSYIKVCPVQQVDFIPIDQQPTKSQLTKLKQRANGHRPGSKPWAVFRFYYRTQQAINNEGFTKSNPKNVFKFDAPPIEKTPVESTATAAVKVPSTIARTTAATAGASSTKVGTTATTTVVTRHDETNYGLCAASVAPELPITAFEEVVTRPVLSVDPGNTDLRSDQRDLTTFILNFPPNNNSEASTIKPTEGLILQIEQPSIMTTIAPQLLEAKAQQISTAIMEVPTIEVNAEKPTEPPVTIAIRPKTPEPVINHVPMANMTTDGETSVEHPTPPATPKPAVEYQARLDTFTNAAKVLETFSELDPETAEMVAKVADTEVPSFAQRAETKAPESIIESIEVKVEPIEPITPKTVGKRVTEPVKTPKGNKRTFFSTPTPEPASKRLKLENSEIEKRIADRKKVLAERRVNRLEAEQKAADTEARRNEALQTILAELDDEIAEEERLAQEAEEQIEAMKAAIEVYTK